MSQKELFIVEGKSASFAIKRAIDHKTQSVYAIQGKLANINNHSKRAVSENLECQKLLSELGGDFSSDYEMEKLPYSKVLVLMDPDIDGVHSSALLLSFIANYLKPIVASGKLSLIKSPKYRLRTGTGEPHYAWSDEELQVLTEKLGGMQTLSKTRFKGIAQYSVEECNQFLLSPSTRRERKLV